MKKIYFLIMIALFCFSEGKAQYINSYSVTSDTSVSSFDCPRTYFQFNTTIAALSYKAILTVNGIADTTTIYLSSTGGRANFTRYIYTPGSYTFLLKLIDTISLTTVYSMTGSFNKIHCSFSKVGIYYDVNGNCIYDAGDYPVYNPAMVEVSLGGTPIDTISCYHETDINNNSVPGTVYRYRILQPPTGFALDCPVTGVIYDTVGVSYVPKTFSFSCITTSGFDLSTYSSVRCGVHRAVAAIIVKNITCNAESAELALKFSPKYHYQNSTIPATSSFSNYATWHFPTLANFSQKYFTAWLEKPPAGPGYAFGDTVNSSYEITPSTGDLNSTNNNVIRLDTVEAGYDPNDIAVYPAGNISSGTELEYTVRFENTGNDTAFNIHVLDTLSDNVVFNTLSVVAASHNMNTVMYSAGGHNIIKFDFPNINLLDSSHHDACNGMFVFKVKSKTGLAFGTEIKNRVGIYFDYNPVVMTNTVINTIPFPTDVTTIAKESGVSIYPNPVKDVLHIKTTNSKFNAVTITNTIGQIITTSQVGNNNESINVQTLPPGIYFLYLKGEGSSSVQRFEKI